MVSQQAHFGYCPNRNERGPFLQDRQTKKKLSDIMINSVNIPESAKLGLCRSEVVLFKIVKRLFEEKLGIGIGQNHKRNKTFAHTLLRTMYGERYLNEIGCEWEECAVEASTLYRHLLYYTLIHLPFLSILTPKTAHKKVTDGSCRIHL